MIRKTIRIVRLLTLLGVASGLSVIGLFTRNSSQKTFSILVPTAFADAPVTGTGTGGGGESVESASAAGDGSGESSCCCESS